MEDKSNFSTFRTALGWMCCESGHASVLDASIPRASKPELLETYDSPRSIVTRTSVADQSDILPGGTFLKGELSSGMVTLNNGVLTVCGKVYSDNIVSVTRHGIPAQSFWCAMTYDRYCFFWKCDTDRVTDGPIKMKLQEDVIHVSWIAWNSPPGSMVVTATSHGMVVVHDWNPVEQVIPTGVRETYVDTWGKLVEIGFWCGVTFNLPEKYVVVGIFDVWGKRDVLALSGERCGEVLIPGVFSAGTLAKINC